MKAQDLDIIDQFNKLKLLSNIFNYFICKSKALPCKDIQTCIESNELKEVLEQYDMHLTNYTLKILPSSSALALSTEESNLKILFNNSNKLNKSLITTPMTENFNIQLLSYFEEEVRIFLKLKKNQIISRSLNKEDGEISNIDETLDNDMKEIFSVMIENLEILNNIFENFKKTQTCEKDNSMNDINNEYLNIKNIIESIVSKILSQLTSEAHFKMLETVRENEMSKTLTLKNEISHLNNAINEYTTQGDELSLLVKEYKKICNIIDCKK